MCFSSKFNSTKACMLLEIGRKVDNIGLKLGSVAGPIIQANGRLTFEDDLRSGGLLCFIPMSARV